MIEDKTRLSDDRQILSSIMQRMDGFLYRCRNDRDYSMIFMEGNVISLTGFDATAFTGSARKSYAGLTHPEDADRVFACVDKALEEKRNWNVDYRISQRDGSSRWVREIGGGVFEGEQLLFLEGVVVDNDSNHRAGLQSLEMLDKISSKSKLLMDGALPIVNVLRILRILATNARLEAARAGPAGAAFGCLAIEISKLSEETAQLAEAISTITNELNVLVAQSQAA